MKGAAAKSAGKHGEDKSISKRRIAFVPVCIMRCHLRRLTTHSNHTGSHHRKIRCFGDLLPRRAGRPIRVLMPRNASVRQYIHLPLINPKANLHLKSKSAIIRPRKRLKLASSEQSKARKEFTQMLALLVKSDMSEKEMWALSLMYCVR